MIPRLLIASLLIAWLGAVVAVRPAGASNTCAASHCYGYAESDNSSDYTGGRTYIHVTELFPATFCADFASAEMWVNTDASGDYWGDSHWVEEGLTNGGRVGNGGCYFAWFWAENSGSTFYAEHYNDNWTAQYNTSIQAKISYGTGVGAWNVYQDGTLIGTSTATQGAHTHSLQAGTEDTNSANIVDGFASGLSRRGSDNSTWYGNWGSAAYLYHDSPVSASWDVVDVAVYYSENP